MGRILMLLDHSQKSYTLLHTSALLSAAKLDLEKSRADIIRKGSPFESPRKKRIGSDIQEICLGPLKQPIARQRRGVAQSSYKVSVARYVTFPPSSSNILFENSTLARLIFGRRQNPGPTLTDHCTTQTCTARTCPPTPQHLHLPRLQVAKARLCLSHSRSAVDLASPLRHSTSSCITTSPPRRCQSRIILPTTPWTRIAMA
jgi:hypothetical protein